MKFRGRGTDAWHTGVDSIVGLQQPTDIHYPCIALQNHTDYYFKKKKKLSKKQIEEQLTALIEGHQRRVDAIAACGHLLPAPIVRNLVIRRVIPPINEYESCDFFKCVISAGHVRPDAFDRIEVERARFFLEKAAGRTPLPWREQFRNVLALVSVRERVDLLWEQEIKSLAIDLFEDLAANLRSWRKENQWTDALHTITWLSAPPNWALLGALESIFRKILSKYKQSWGAWARWNPDRDRCLSCSRHSALCTHSAYQDLFALVGPDSLSDCGNEEAT